MKSVRPRSSLGSAFVLPRTSARCRCLVVHPSMRTLPCLFICCAPFRAHSSVLVYPLCTRPCSHSSVLVYPRALFRARTLPCSFILVTNFYLSRLPDLCIYPMHLLQLQTCFYPCRLLLLLLVDTNMRGLLLLLRVIMTLNSLFHFFALLLLVRASTRDNISCKSPPPHWQRSSHMFFPARTSSAAPAALPPFPLQNNG